MIALAEGLHVRYKHYVGFIQFIDNAYLTMCIGEFEHKSRQVCILIYRNEWDQVTLLKESEK